MTSIKSYKGSPPPSRKGVEQAQSVKGQACRALFDFAGASPEVTSAPLYPTLPCHFPPCGALPLSLHTIPYTFHLTLPF
jgi:hypothetical protein